MKTLLSAAVYNEAAKVASVARRVRESAPAGVDFMLVDDGSTDGTAEIAERAGVRVVRHGRRRGAGAAVRTMIETGRREGYEVLVVMAGNDKDDPSELDRLRGPIERGEADLVQGSRYLKGGGFRNTPLYRRFATRLVHPLLFSVFAGQRMTDTTNGFRAIRLAMFDDARFDLGQEWLDRYELEPYLLFKAVRLGYRVKEAPVTKIYPPKGAGSYTKMKPIVGWWSILRPIFLLGLGLKK